MLIRAGDAVCCLLLRRARIVDGSDAGALVVLCCRGNCVSKENMVFETSLAQHRFLFAVFLIKVC